MIAPGKMEDNLAKGAIGKTTFIDVRLFASHMLRRLGYTYGQQDLGSRSLRLDVEVFPMKACSRLSIALYCHATLFNSIELTHPNNVNSNSGILKHQRDHSSG